MLRLRKILLCDFVFYFLFILIAIITLFRIFHVNTSKYSDDTKIITGRVREIRKNDTGLNVIIYGKEKVLCYFDDDYLINFNLNDLIVVHGQVEDIKKSGILNTFDYKRYLYNQKIYFIFKVSKVKVIKKNSNIFYELKKKIITKIDKSINRAYFKAFILGDTKDIKDEIVLSYRNNGISHLFAISGMHITLISTMLLKIFKRCRMSEKKRYMGVILFLIFYLFLTGVKASILRAILFFILLSINKYYYFYIKTINIFILTLGISLLYNPLYLFDVGFQFSYVISFFLLTFQDILKKTCYINNLLLVSVISFLAGLPIVVNNFYQINILGIILNLIFVPLISFIIFPLSLVTFCFPFFDKLLFFMTSFLEKMSYFFSKITFLTFIIGKLSIFLIFIYYVILIFSLFLFRKKKLWGFFLLIVLCFYFYFRVIDGQKLIMLDVDQGDCLLLISDKKIALVDTGGIKDRFGNNKSSITDNVITFLKSLGIKKIDYLFLTHGDYDHMGNSYQLVSKFDVKKVYFNNGNYNENEKKLIDILERRKISYDKFYKGEVLKLGNIELMQLNTYFSDENDNSMILYGKYCNLYFLLMADASKRVENYILSAYNLKKVDILKVGHHGSDTSSGREFLKVIKPKYALISVGLNNKFKHPSKAVIDRLNEIDSIILETRYDGTVILNLDLLVLK